MGNLPRVGVDLEPGKAEEDLLQRYLADGVILDVELVPRSLEGAEYLQAKGECGYWWGEGLAGL